MVDVTFGSVLGAVGLAFLTVGVLAALFLIPLWMFVRHRNASTTTSSVSPPTTSVVAAPATTRSRSWMEYPAVRVGMWVLLALIILGFCWLVWLAIQSTAARSLVSGALISPTIYTTLMFVLLCFAAFMATKRQWQIMKVMIAAGIGVVVVGEVANYIAAYGFSLPGWIAGNFTLVQVAGALLPFLVPALLLLEAVIIILVASHRIAHGLITPSSVLPDNTTVRRRRSVGSLVGLFYTLVALGALALLTLYPSEAVQYAHTVQLVDLSWLDETWLRAIILVLSLAIILPFLYFDKFLKVVVYPATLVIGMLMLVTWVLSGSEGLYATRALGEAKQKGNALWIHEQACLAEQELPESERAADFQTRCGAALDRAQRRAEVERQQEEAAAARLQEENERLAAELAAAREAQVRQEVVGAIPSPAPARVAQSDTTRATQECPSSSEAGYVFVGGVPASTNGQGKLMPTSGSCFYSLKQGEQSAVWNWFYTTNSGICFARVDEPSQNVVLWVQQSPGGAWKELTSNIHITYGSLAITAKHDALFTLEWSPCQS